jgi:hypothetical protein
VRLPKWIFIFTGHRTPVWLCSQKLVCCVQVFDFSSLHVKASKLMFYLSDAITYVQHTIPFFLINIFMNEFHKRADAGGNLSQVMDITEIADLVQAAIEIHGIVEEACKKMNVTPNLEVIGFPIFKNGHFPMHHTKVEAIYCWLITNINIQVPPQQPSQLFHKTKHMLFFKQYKCCY